MLLDSGYPVHSYIIGDGSDREMLEKRYAERYPIYTGKCDVHMKNDGTAEALADKIIKDFVK